MKFSGYTLYKATCSECEYEEDLSSTTMRITGAKLTLENGDKCPDCDGVISVTMEEVTAEEHKEAYLNYHADDEHDRDR